MTITETIYIKTKKENSDLVSREDTLNQNHNMASNGRRLEQMIELDYLEITLHVGG